MPTSKRERAPGQEAESDISIRRLVATDSIDEITSLLHRAYRGQVEMGLRPLAGRQDAATTAKRCASGECFLAIDRSGAIVGTILFHEVEDAQGPEWFRRGDVDYFSQFAVDPSLHGRGVGLRLLETVERRTVECGSAEIACSMAEPDTRLLAFYQKRGYRTVGHWQWPYTNYRSVVLSKTVGARAG